MKHLRKIFLRNFVAILGPVLICVLITGGVFGKYYYTQLTNKTKSSIENTLYQTRDAVESWMNNVNTIVIEMSLSNDTYYELKDLLEKPYLNSFEKRTLKNRTSTLNALLSANKELKSAYIYIPNETGNFYASGEETMVNLSSFYDTAWLAEYERLTKEKAVSVFFHDVQRYEFEGSRNTLTIIRAFPSHNGAVVLNIDMKSIDAYLRALNLPANSLFVLKDKSGEAYRFGNTSSRQSLNNYIEVASPAYPFEYVMYLSDNDLRTQLQTTLIYIGTPCAIATVLGLISAMYLTTKRHRKLKEIAETFASEGFNISEEDISTNDEYGYISANIAKLLLEMDKRKYDAEILQLEAAQYQLTPHFLFNTLESICFECMDLTGGENEASEMVTKLAAILKYSLRFPNEQVTVAKEVEIANLYSDIMKMRDPGKFEVHFEVDPECERLILPKLFLQPLIENSIYHGAKEKGSFTMIVVSVRMVEERLQIIISDNGKGMDEARLAEVNASIRENSRKHIGLGNIYRRLATQYHDEFNMEILKNEAGGIDVLITIPTSNNMND